MLHAFGYPLRFKLYQHNHPGPSQHTHKHTTRQMHDT